MACGTGGEGSTPTQPGGPISQTASAYLDQLMGFMQSNSINRLTIDWNTFRAKVLAQAAGAQSIPDTYPAIRVALTLLADGHSSFRTPTGSVIFVPNRTCTGSGAANFTPPRTIGYVRVGSFSGSESEANAFANGIQNTIIAADKDGLTGWIVDVRGNGGGNMWPMIAGVGPVLGDGLLGYFVDPLGAQSFWELVDGASFLNGFVQTRVGTPYRLRHERPKVAVLTDNAVASSGEATVIAFRQRADTRTFGTPTCGLSTANSGFGMSDGATLILTVAVMADRTRTKYGDSIQPDEAVTDPAEAVQRAIAWLQAAN
jgi:C-terminal processing protease CtpA/Prc